MTGRSRAIPVETDARHPASADVVVIGGGNIGTATAYYLAKMGLSVVLCEKGAIGGEASGRSVGHVNNLWAEPAKVPLSHLAGQLWSGLNAELGEETGFRQDGLLIKIRSEEERARWQKWVAESKPLSNETRFLDRAQLAEIVTTDTPWFGSIFDPISGRAEPKLVAPAFAKAARRLGAHVVAPCAVRGIEMGGGRVTGVVTEFGPIKTSHVVLASGAWTSLFLNLIGLDHPIATTFSWAASVKTEGIGPKSNGIFENHTWRSQLDGGYTIAVNSSTYPLVPSTFRHFGTFLGAYWDQITDSGARWHAEARVGNFSTRMYREDRQWALDEVSPFERLRILQPEINGPLMSKMQQFIAQSIPAFRNSKLTDIWGGAVSHQPGSLLPAFGPVASIDGLVVVASVANGLGLAPAMGSILAELVSGKAPSVDIKPFQLEFMK